MPWTSEAAPYAFVFTAVLGAAVIAGWRSGLIALVLGQVLVWVFVLEPHGRFAAKDSEQVAGVVVATFAQLIVLGIITLYQREVKLASSRRESQLGLLEQALKEIDHRTSNNYQTVLALVLAQAQTAREPEAKAALQQVADRIRAIAAASTKLALASLSLEEVRIDEHLEELCNQIERGLARPGVALECEFEDLVIGADQTVSLSIIVNELVTNALKHAFPGDRPGTIRIALEGAAAGIALTVEDDGVGIGGSGRSRGTGLGKRLIATFVKQLGARHEVSSPDGGTRHRIFIPA